MDSGSHGSTGSNALSGQDTSLETHELLLHSGQQLTSAVLSDLGSQPESQLPHQGDRSSLVPPTCPPTNNEPVIPTTKQSTEVSSNRSTDQSTSQSNDQTSSTLTSEQLSSQSTQLSLDTTHTQQSFTEDTGDATATYSAHNSRPKQRIPAVHRSSRSYSASRTSRTPSRKSCHSVKMWIHLHLTFEPYSRVRSAKNLPAHLTTLKLYLAKSRKQTIIHHNRVVCLRQSVTVTIVFWHEDYEN